MEKRLQEMANRWKRMEMRFRVRDRDHGWEGRWLDQIHEEAGLQATHVVVSLANDPNRNATYDAFTEHFKYKKTPNKYDADYTTAVQVVGESRDSELAFEEMFAAPTYRYVRDEQLLQRMFREVITMHYRAVWEPAVRARQVDAWADIDEYQGLLKEFDASSERFVSQPTDANRLAVIEALRRRWESLYMIREKHGLNERQVLKALSNADLVRNNVGSGQYTVWISDPIDEPVLYNSFPRKQNQMISDYWQRLADYRLYLRIRHQDEMAGRRLPLGDRPVRTPEQMLRMYDNWHHFVNMLEIESNISPNKQKKNIVRKARTTAEVQGPQLVALRVEYDPDENFYAGGWPTPATDPRRTGEQSLPIDPQRFNPMTAGERRSPANRVFMRYELATRIDIDVCEDVDEVLATLAQIDPTGVSGLVWSPEEYVRRVSDGEAPLLQPVGDGFPDDPIRPLYIIRDLLRLEALFYGERRQQMVDSLVTHGLTPKMSDVLVLRRHLEVIDANREWRDKHQELRKTRVASNRKARATDTDGRASRCNRNTCDSFHPQTDSTQDSSGAHQTYEFDPPGGQSSRRASKRESRGDSARGEGSKRAKTSAANDYSAPLVDQLAALYQRTGGPYEPRLSRHQIRDLFGADSDSDETDNAADVGDGAQDVVLNELTPEVAEQLAARIDMSAPINEMLAELARMNPNVRSGFVPTLEDYINEHMARQNPNDVVPRVEGFVDLPAAARANHPIIRLYLIRELRALHTKLIGYQTKRRLSESHTMIIKERERELMHIIEQWIVWDDMLHERANRDARAADIEPNQWSKRQSRPDSTHTEGRASMRVKKRVVLSKSIDYSAPVNDQLAALNRLLPGRHCRLVPRPNKYLSRVRKYSDPTKTGLPDNWRALTKEFADPDWRLAVIRDLRGLESVLIRWRNDPKRSHEERERSGRHLQYLWKVLGAWRTRHTLAALVSDENTSQTSGRELSSAHTSASTQDDGHEDSNQEGLFGGPSGLAPATNQTPAPGEVPTPAQYIAGWANNRRPHLPIPQERLETFRTYRANRERVIGQLGELLVVLTARPSPLSEWTDQAVTNERNRINEHIILWRDYREWIPATATEPGYYYQY